MIPPMADPMQPPLPAKPRPNPGVQMPMTPQVAQQQNSINSLLSDKVQSESGDDGMMAQGGGMGDMTAATMGMGGKLSRDRRLLALIGPNPKTGFGKSADAMYRPNGTESERARRARASQPGDDGNAAHFARGSRRRECGSERAKDAHAQAAVRRSGTGRDSATPRPAP